MAEDNRNFGHMIIDCFRKLPDAICQIDASTGESETNASVLSRSIQLANCLRSYGLVPGDVIALGGRNHLDLHIPFYSALFNGLPLVGVDPFFKYAEIKSILKITSPKIAFCEPEDYDHFSQAAKDLGLQTKIVTFGDGENSMKSFIEKYKTNDNEENFEPAVVDLDSSYLWLISTSGTTGSVKVAAFTVRVWLRKFEMYTKMIRTSHTISDNQTALNLSPIQWVSGMLNLVSMPLLGQTMVQTSAPATVEHVIDMINKYKPVQALISPSMLSYMMKHEKKCDWTCFKALIIIGAKLPDDLLVEVRSRLAPGAMAVEAYGQTETMGPVLAPYPGMPVGSCGTATTYEIQLVDPDTNAVITEPNVPGEMWVKGLIFKEYYNSPEETAKAFSEDGWYKTGDLLHRDALGNYFYRDRMKTLIKYQNYHVSPIEIEEVIRRHPGVLDVAATGVPAGLDGEVPVACVVRREGATVTEQELVDLVAKNLSEKKRLRGGVIFLKEMPHTSTGKISIKQVKEIARRAFQTDNNV